MITRLAAPLLLIALAASAAVNVATWAKLSAERLAHQTTLADHATAIAAAQSERAALEAKHRQTEQDLNDVIKSEAEKVAAISADLDLNRDRAAAASKRLRTAVQAAAVRARAECAASDASDLRQATGDPIGVLGRVLAELDEKSGIVAEFADRSRIAGLACERLYDKAQLLSGID